MTGAGAPPDLTPRPIGSAPLQTLRHLRAAHATSVVATLVVVALLGACGASSDIRSRLEQDFTRTVGSRTSSSAAYYSTRTAADAAAYVNRYVVANETITDAATGGRFLQYRDAVVGVFDCAKAAGVVDAAVRSDVAAGCGPRTTGSVVFVDDYTRGRTRWLPYVGRRWGVTSGLGPSFRGGGSGDGK